MRDFMLSFIEALGTGTFCMLVLGVLFLFYNLSVAIFEIQSDLKKLLKKK